MGETRGTNAEGRKIYTLFDVYPHADLVTYPSHYEGFGNAFLEAIYFGKPVVVNPKRGRIEMFRRVLPTGTPILNWGCKHRGGDAPSV